MATFHGTDVSNHQGAAMVDAWDQVVAQAGTGGWWKASEGRTYKDPYADRHRVATAAVGLRYRGPYHWLTPGSSVADQFKNFHDVTGPLHEGEAIQIDIEDPAGLSDAQVIEAIDTWEDAYPGRVLHYMGRFYMRSGGSYLVDRMLARYGDSFRWWLPWYQYSFPGGLIPTNPVVWQWAGGASGVLINGVGRVDSNEIIATPALEIISGYGVAVPAPSPGGAMSANGTLVLLTDSWVVLEGDMNDQGRIVFVRWIGPDRMTERMGAGYQQITRTTSDLGGMTYIGSHLPFGDGGRPGHETWDGSEFQDYVITGSPGGTVDVASIVAQAVAAARADTIARLSNG